MSSILLIEDDPWIRARLRRLLEEAGYTVSDAANGLDGYRQYRESPSDLVITDMMLPEQDGLETIVGIRRDFPNAKIIAITGADRPYKPVHSAGAMGARAVFGKPVDGERLLASVKDLLDEES